MSFREHDLDACKNEGHLCAPKGLVARFGARYAVIRLEGVDTYISNMA